MHICSGGVVVGGQRVCWSGIVTNGEPPAKSEQYIRLMYIIYNKLMVLLVVTVVGMSADNHR